MRTAVNFRSALAVGHVSVLVDAVVAQLAPKAGGVYVDGTFGAGGYSAALLDAADCQVIGIDQDPTAHQRAENLLALAGKKLRLLRGRFGDMAALLRAEAVDKVDGIALDIGVSSWQLDEAERGFSFRLDGPLDMRMAQQGQSAAELVNNLSASELADIFWRYGEERQSRRIAAAIIRRRAEQPITRTLELAELVKANTDWRHDGTHPATRVFQALRIAVNDELGELQRALLAAEALLAPGGRLAVVTFHSLEDRLVKEFFTPKQQLQSRHLPMAAAAASPWRVLHKKPITADSTEIAANPRARSAKLRTAERVVH